MGLDIHTPRGQLTLKQELEAAACFEREHPGQHYVHTPKDGKCAVDALIVRDGKLCAVVETKCRDCDLHTLRGAFNNLWLVTMKKIIDARGMAMALDVPLYGFLWLTRDQVLLVQRVTKRDGTWVANFISDESATQKTCNGGSIVRENAYIDMSEAKVYEAVCEVK